MTAKPRADRPETTPTAPGKPALETSSLLPDNEAGIYLARGCSATSPCYGHERAIGCWQDDCRTAERSDDEIVGEIGESNLPRIAVDEFGPCLELAAEAVAGANREQVGEVPCLLWHCGHHFAE